MKKLNPTRTLIIIIFCLSLTFVCFASVNFQEVDWTDYLGARFSFIIKQLGIPDHIYAKRYNQDEKEDDIVFIYRGANVDMRAYIWKNEVYRFYFSNKHKFNIYKGVRTQMTKAQIKSILGEVNKVTEKGLHLWKDGNIKLIVDFDETEKAKEILLSLNEH